ncbi:CoA ester lyase [Rhodococcus sp. HNM0563]|uniref:HpcH/HpaI aldolase/citrate lyase family protein n=1 Tax=Rhodococcus sp. HNM0563 TaxID=2716339 RepID=UPI00146D23BA|nr:CoA ester lyase [Rhodococcus sp. HNM0563]NLU61892.1 CoA ester lyase [Rhodococcus sp. HNM0563]
MRFPVTSEQHLRRRAVLVAPGSDERKAGKALASVADEVVLDLEDAVTPDRKSASRDLIAPLVRTYGAGRTVSVRINGRGTEWFEDDLRACAELGDALASIVFPKVESADDLVDADRILGKDSPVGIQALIETPAGVQNIDEIVVGPRVAGVIIGYADLGAALGRARTAAPEHWLYVQDRVLHAARSAGVQAIDGPFLGIADDAAFQHSARWVSDLGFDGKWVIHPAQIDSATAAFTPTGEQVEAARKVLAALEEAEARGAGAAQLDGQMLDEAVAVAARRTLTKIGA